MVLVKKNILLQTVSDRRKPCCRTIRHSTNLAGLRRLTHLLWVLYLFPPWLAAPLLSPDIRWLVLFIEVGWTANQFSTPKGAPEQENIDTHSLQQTSAALPRELLNIRT